MDNYSFSQIQPRYPVGKMEFRFGILTVTLAVGLWNSILYGGFNLGFAFFSLGLLGCNVWYFGKNGCRFGAYETALLIFAALGLAGFARSADGTVKAVMLLATLFAVNLSFCLVSNQNRRGCGGFGTLFDAPRAFFTFGFGGMGPALRGLEDARKNAGSAGKKGSAALLGVVIAVPVVAVMLPLLMRSDAAFEGLMGLLPETDWTEPFLSLAFGLFAAWVLFARALGLRQKPPLEDTKRLTRRISPITVNILLGAVCGLYLAYLLSQLAYFSGGFLGILPEGYTLAEYARRGFFEMAWLSAINLCLILICSGLVERQDKLPAATKGQCLFLGLVTLFLIGTASAKMLLYIDSYGLTRLRILTQTVMLWLAVSTVLVTIRLGRQQFPYMKGVILTALLLMNVLLWVDVDGLVARYNVRAYQQEKLGTVDMDHLSSLGYGATPYIAELTEDPDPEIARQAASVLYHRSASSDGLRSWNYARGRAESVLNSDSRVNLLRGIGKKLDVDLSRATLAEYRDTHGGFHGDGDTYAVITLPEEAAPEAESRMEYGAPWWKPLPLTEELSRVLYGDGENGPLCPDAVPEVKRGWYFFYDAQGHPYIEESLFSRPSFNFSIALYDADTQTMYYFSLDT